MNKAIVVGSLNMDIVAFVRQHPKIGETVFGREVRYLPGGKGANQAVSCRRLGCETLMVGRLGDDAFGRQLLDFQRQEGIDTRGIRRLNNVETGTAFVTVSEDSANSIVVIPGANAQWDDDFIDELPIAAGDIVLAQFEIPDRVIELAFNLARMRGATTILNPAPIREVSRRIRELTDLLVVNEHELASLAECEIDVDDDTSVFNAAAKLSENAYRAVVVTLGERGARLIDAGRPCRIDARAVNAVDTTGAGDTFIGGLAAGLLNGLNLRQAAELAGIAASISVTRAGAAASIPTWDEVETLWPSRETKRS